MATVGTIEYPGTDLPVLAPKDVDRDNDLLLVWDDSASRLKTMEWPRIDGGTRMHAITDYGADPNAGQSGAAANTAIDNALSAAGANEKVIIPAGSFRVHNGLTQITTGSAGIYGEGEDCSILNYTADTDDEIMIDIAVNQTSFHLRDFMIQAPTETSYNKTAIKVGDGSKGGCRHILIRSWGGANTDSIATIWAGREEWTWEDMTIRANAPVVWDENIYGQDSPPVARDMDNVVYRDMDIIVTDSVDSAGPLKRLADGMSYGYQVMGGASFVAGNPRLLGRQLVAKGGGIWYAPTGTPDSNQLTQSFVINNLVTEQRSAGSYHCYINPTLNGVGGMVGVLSVTGGNGYSNDPSGVPYWYVRGTRHTRIRDWHPPNDNTATVFDFDAADTAFESFGIDGIPWYSGALAAQISKGIGSVELLNLSSGGANVPFTAIWGHDGSPAPTATIAGYTKP